MVPNPAQHPVCMCIYIYIYQSISPHTSVLLTPFLSISIFSTVLLMFYFMFPSLSVNFESVYLMCFHSLYSIFLFSLSLSLSFCPYPSASVSPHSASLSLSLKNSHKKEVFSQQLSVPERDLWEQFKNKPLHIGRF